MNERQIDIVIDKWDKLQNIAMLIKKNNGIFEKPKYSQDISPRQFYILMSTTFGQLNSVTELSKSMKISKSTLSIIISKMENKGYIQRTKKKNQGDSRWVIVESTEAGKEIIYSLAKCRLKNFENFYNELSDEGRSFFKKGITFLKQITGEYTDFFMDISNRLYSERREVFSEFSEEIVDMSKELIYFTTVFLKSPDGIKEGMYDLQKNTNLTITQLKLIMTLINNNISTISELEEHTRTSVSALSICISRLEKKGYIEKNYCKSQGDGRRMYMTVTPKCKAMLETEFKKYYDLKRSFLYSLNEEQLAAYGNALDCLIKAFSHTFIK